MSGFTLPGLVEKSEIALILGITSHLLYFRHGEHHMQALIIFWIFVAAYLALIVDEYFIYAKDIALALHNASWISFGYAAGLWTSMSIYRIFFHRLRSFPGPPLAKITKFWHSFKLLDSRNHLLMEELNKQYGDIVRTG